MSKASRMKKKKLLKENNNIKTNTCDDIELLNYYKQKLENLELELQCMSKPISSRIITMKELEKMFGIKDKNKLFNKPIQKSNWKYRY